MPQLLQKRWKLCALSCKIKGKSLTRLPIKVYHFVDRSPSAPAEMPPNVFLAAAEVPSAALLRGELGPTSSKPGACDE
jgi:hypothetical protein